MKKYDNQKEYAQGRGRVGLNRSGSNELGVFQDRSSADRAVGTLLEDGNPYDRITIYCRGEQSSGKASGLQRKLVGLGFPTDDAKHREEDVQHGSTLVTVECESSCDLVEATLRDCGAINVEAATAASGTKARSGERTWGGTMPTSKAYRKRGIDSRDWPSDCEC